MKIAITGKGGVGKTTLASLLIYHMSQKGKRVIAVDADPDANLASALGFSDAEEIIPISEMYSLIEERTGAKPGSSGSFFKVNPKVDDLPDKLSIERDNIRLMVMGTVKKGGSGCVCPESVLLKNLINHIVLYRDDVVIMDMEAGIEHLGRGTSSAVNMLIVVVEPGMRSIETAKKINILSKDLGIKKVAIVGNKIRTKSDQDFIRENVEEIEILGFIPFNESLIESDMKGIPASSRFIKEIEVILNHIDSRGVFYET